MLIFQAFWNLSSFEMYVIKFQSSFDNAGVPLCGDIESSSFI